MLRNFKHHKPDENFAEDYICCNDNSDNCADWTDYNDVCDEWEGKDNELLKRMEDKLGG